MDLSTFKQLLEIDDTDTSKDVILQQTLDSATTIIEQEIRYPLSVKSYTDVLSGTATQYLLIHTYPIVALTTVLESLNDVSSDITTEVSISDSSIGKLYRSVGFNSSYTYTITYTAGYSTIPQPLEYVSRVIALKLYAQLDRIKDGVTRVKTPDGLVVYDNSLLSSTVSAILNDYKHIEVG